MANNLTGDFDVVAEFSLAAVNRILAAMHQCERFLHSISVRVDDNPHPSRPGWPTALGVVDAFGDAIADQQRIGSPNPFPNTAVIADVSFARSGALLNPDLLNGVTALPPSHIQGTAQMQLFPPTVETSGGNLSVRINVMVRFFPDKGAAPLAQFMRGDLVITAPVNKVATGRVHVLDINFKADDATITFSPSYTSESLSFQDIAGISLCIQNGLRTSFLPSSITLPSSIADVQLKPLPGAIAVLLDFNDHTPASTVASVNNVFVTANDDFAFAAGREYLLNTLGSLSSNILSQPPTTMTVTAHYHFTFRITLTSATFDLQPGPVTGSHSGYIVMTIKGHADPLNHTWVGSADFTVTAQFTLQPSGNTVELGVANVSASIDNFDSVASILGSLFTNNLSSNAKNIILTALAASGAQSTVEKMFDADANLGTYLNAQFTPADSSPPTQTQQIFFLYTFAEIQADGVVVRGLNYMHFWPAANIEFEQIPATVSSINGVNVFGNGPDYSALKTWIPGGTIDQYEWSYQGQPNPFDTDPNRFVLLASGPGPTEAYIATTVVSGYTPLCLTVQGTRIQYFGPGTAPQSVVGSICAFTRFPVVPGGVVAAQGVSAPVLALARPGANGNVTVAGHIAAQTSQRGSGVPNLLVHFSDAKTATQLDVLIQALNQSKKADAPTAAIAVVAADQLPKIRYTPGIIYAEDTDRSWQTILGLKSVKRPLTVIVNPRGIPVWQKEGAPDLNELATALNKYLVATNAVRITVPRVNVRIGQPAPNFLFEISPATQMPLAKLRGQTVTLAVWKASSSVSINAVRRLHREKEDAPILLAINDGDSPDIARAVAAENGFLDALVTDPKREISSGYGVEIWPTIVSLDESGVITSITYGDNDGEHHRPNPKNKAAARTR